MSPSKSRTYKSPHQTHKMVKCKMGIKGLWVAVLLIFITGYCSATIRVELKMPRYVAVNHNATLHCVHSAEPEIVYRVEWRKAGTKIFQFIKGRHPPYINYTIHGAELDWENCNDKQIRLTKLDFSASGAYTCVVSVETPLIFTKESQKHELEVILPQSSNPKITFEKAVYTVGEKLVANCTTSIAKPPPHITWLINNQKVDEQFVKNFPHLHPGNTNNLRNTYSSNTNALNIQSRPIRSHHRPHAVSSVSQLSIEVSKLHAGDSGQLDLTCVSTIPGYFEEGQYADMKMHTVTIDVAVVDEVFSSEITNVNSTSTQIESTRVCNLFISVFLSLQLRLN